MIKEIAKTREFNYFKRRELILVFLEDGFTDNDEF